MAAEISQLGPLVPDQSPGGQTCSFRQSVQTLILLLFIRHYKFACFGRGLSPFIGHQVGNGHIDLMTDGRYDRNL